MSALRVGVRTLARVVAGGIFVGWAGSAVAQTVTVVTDGTLAAPARHGLAKLGEALRAKGFAVREVSDVAADTTFVVLAGVRAQGGAATTAVTTARATLPDGPEALTIRRSGQYGRKRAIVLLSRRRNALCRHRSQTLRALRRARPPNDRRR